MWQERIKRMKTSFRTENWKEKWFRDKTGELRFISGSQKRWKKVLVVIEKKDLESETSSYVTSKNA